MGKPGNRIKRAIGIALLMAVMGGFAARAGADVHDNASIFSPQAIADANAAMSSMAQKHNKQLVIETFAKVPDDRQAALRQQGNDAFFKQWKADRANELKVEGVYVLICMDPKYIETGVGKYTLAQGDFTADDVTALRKQLQTAMHAREYDKGLGDAVNLVERTFSRRTPGSAGNPLPLPERSDPPVNTFPPENVLPQANGLPPGIYLPPTSHTPPAHFPPTAFPRQTFPNPSDNSFGFSSLFCIIFSAIAVLVVLRLIFGSRVRGGYQGWGGGGGGGFGSGFLGGLLGGAVGGFAASEWERSNQNNSAFPPTNDSSIDMSNNSNLGSSGGSFDSGPSDSGQSFGGGGDFSGGGGADSGGSF